MRIARRNGSSSSTIKSRGIRSFLRNRLGHRQGYLRAASFGGADRHLAALSFDDVAGEGQAEPGAAPRLLGGEERLSDAAQQMLRDADAVVAHGQAQLVSGTDELDADVGRLAALGRFERVVEKVCDGLLEGADR